MRASSASNKCRRSTGAELFGWVRVAVQATAPPGPDLVREEEGRVPIVIDRYDEQWYADEFARLPDVRERVYASEEEAMQAGYEKAKRAQAEGKLRLRPDGITEL